MTETSAKPAIYLAESDIRPVPDRRERLAIAVVIVFAVILLHPYGFLEAEDAAVYFGYMNNQSHPGIPFYYAGYLAFMPELAASLAYFLPMSLQPPIYVMTAALVGTYFVYQLLVFTDIYFPIRPIALVLACAIILFSVKTNSSFNFFTNMTYSIWIAWLGLFLRILNGFHGVRARWYEITIGVLAAVSHPFCVILLPALGFLWFALPASRTRWWMVELALYTAAIGLYFVFGIDYSLGKAFDPGVIVGNAVGMMSDHPGIYTVLAFAAQIYLTAVGLWALCYMVVCRYRKQGPGYASIDLLVLSYMGCSTFLVFVGSTRFVPHDTLQPRYIIPAVVCAWLSTIILTGMLPAVARLRLKSKRLIPSWREEPKMVVLSIIGILSLVGAAEIKGRQTPSIGFGAIWQGEQFLMEAEAFRKTCDGGAFARAWNKWSLLILCKRADLPSAVEPVPIVNDHVHIYGSGTVASSIGREPASVPALFRPVRDSSLTRLP